VFMRPGIHLTRSLVFTDTAGVDGAATGVGRLVAGASGRWRKVQNGYARSYALTMLVGVVLLVGAVWVMQ
jgi:NADH-quinone oxidoreductase subunit L